MRVGSWGLSDRPPGTPPPPCPKAPASLREEPEGRPGPGVGNHTRLPAVARPVTPSLIRMGGPGAANVAPRRHGPHQDRSEAPRPGNTPQICATLGGGEPTALSAPAPPASGGHRPRPLQLSPEGDVQGPVARGRHTHVPSGRASPPALPPSWNRPLQSSLTSPRAEAGPSGHGDKCHSSGNCLPCRL